MTKIRFQRTQKNADGTVGLRRSRVDDGQGVTELVLTFAEGQEELAAEVTSMLNALEVRRDFDAHRINSMYSVQDNDLVRRTGDEHAAVLPVLREMAREVGQAVLAWTAYADHLWALLMPPEPLFVPPVDVVRGAGQTSLTHLNRSLLNGAPKGMSVVLHDDLEPVRKLYGHAMANVRSYETYLEEIQKRIDQEFGHLPQPPEGGPYRQGTKQPRNLYRHEEGDEIGGTFIGVAFDAEDARLIKEALNEHYHKENS